jgi:predicted permease
MATLIHVVMARIAGVFRSGQLEDDFDEELTTHLAMAEADKMRRGMTLEQARRAALLELGGLTQLREATRATRGLPWLGTFWLDVKLGVRMLRKSWGLTLVGGLAMTIVIAIAAGAFGFLQVLYGSQVPLDDGNRVVALQTWDAARGRPHGTSLPDFERWRNTVRSVTDLGAFRTVRRRLVTGGVPASAMMADGTEPLVSIAEMSASGFQLARVAPLLGRPLVQNDERPGAIPVVVIGYDVWQSRFAADQGVVGRRVRLDESVHTVVGVMPEDFAFPVAHHFWTPLRVGSSGDPLDQAPDVVVFGRLAAGITLEGAQAELTTIGLLPAAADLEPTIQLQPRVASYPRAFGANIEPWIAGLIVFLVSLLLAPPCANIAILVYARTITRQEEFSARYALGASRGRIVGQLFVEALVLATAAAGVALTLVHLALRRVEFSTSYSPGGSPFWMEFGLSPTMVLFAAGLALFAAAIAGLVPALQATGRLMQAGLQALGSRTRVQLGATWTALVVAQVALALAVLPSAAELAWGLLRPGILGPGFTAEEFLTARLELDQEMLPSGGASRRAPGARFADLQAELVRQLDAEPGVLGVSVTAAVPGNLDQRGALVEIDGVPSRAISLSSGHEVTFLPVDDAVFDLFDTPLLAGRLLDASDVAPEQATVIINRTFAQDILTLSDRNPLGLRVRYFRGQGIARNGSASRNRGQAAALGPWYEIVGVVDDLPANTNTHWMYHPLVPEQMRSVSLTLRLGARYADMAARLPEMTAALDPALRVDEIRPLDEFYLQQRRSNYAGAFALAVVTLSVLLLSAAGLYALMAFTVSQRRREIGIRSALGAQPQRLLVGIFRRALGQVAVGALVGLLMAFVLGKYLMIEELGGWAVPGVVPAAAILMLGVGLLAAVGPALRGLKIEPTEALRDG